MMHIIKFLLLLILLANSINIRAQIFRNCSVSLLATRKDSSSLKAFSNQATVELDMQSGEITLKVKTGSFSTNDSSLSQELKTHPELIVFRGYLGMEPGKIPNNQLIDKNYAMTAVVKIKGIKHATTASYSLFQKSNSTGNSLPLMLNLAFSLSLSDFNIGEYFPDLLDFITIQIIRQPVNIIAE